MSELRGPIFARSDYAGFFRRMSALLIDAIIVVAVLVCALAAYEDFQDPYSPYPPEAFRVVVAWLLFALAYNVGFRLSMYGTPGYRLMRIRYAYMLAGRPGKLWVVTRSLWATFLTFFFALNHVWILFDPRKQAWHDKLSGFYVVKRRANPIGEQRIVRRVIGFFGYNLIVWEPATEHKERTGGTLMESS